jgi:1,4-alpha-glucan branching enzyme
MKGKVVIKRLDSKTRENNRKQRFVFTAPEAESVQLVGDFTHWTKQPINLRKSNKGIWETTVDLTKGNHLYRFLVDGRWQDDPKAVLRVPNPYGTQDSVTCVD